MSRPISRHIHGPLFQFSDDSQSHRPSLHDTRTENGIRGLVPTMDNQDLRNSLHVSSDGLKR